MEVVVKTLFNSIVFYICIFPHHTLLYQVQMPVEEYVLKKFGLCHEQKSSKMSELILFSTTMPSKTDSILNLSKVLKRKCKNP